METPKVCLGCFSEWNEEDTVCPRCGWKPGKNDEDIFGWKSGVVLEKRYLLGKLYLKIQDAAVWRIYDNVLKLSCFVLRLEEDGELDALARRLQEVSRSRGNFLEVLTVKTLARKNVLIFSMKDRYMESNVFRLYLLLALADAGGGREESPEGNLAECPGSVRKMQALSPGMYLGRRYRVVACVGVGGFGILYLCEDEVMHRPVAAKEYFPEEWAERDGAYVAVKSSAQAEAYRYGMGSFLREVAITANFIHTPGIVTIFDVIEANDTIYMITEYIPGNSIGREMRIRGYKPYTAAETAKIMLPVLDALDAVHNKYVVHSDVSPGNIMRSGDGDIRLIDMGASKYFLESQPPVRAAFLKIDYAAPEQFRTAQKGISRDEGPWTDIYGAGATMYYLLTGHKPVDVLNRLNGVELVPPKKYKVRLPKPWFRLIGRAMALNKEERISSASEFGEEIRKLLR